MNMAQADGSTFFYLFDMAGALTDVERRVAGDGNA
jgi:hypothetical protein